MTLEQAKDALRGGAEFGDTNLTMTHSRDLLSVPALEELMKDQLELRRFFCYELLFQERWRAKAEPQSNGVHKILGQSLPPPGSHAPNKRLIAKEMGYEGSPCETCGGMKVKRNGSCLICETCHTTTGCS